MVALYNVIRPSQTFADGVFTSGQTIVETRSFDVQALQLLKWGDFGRVEVEIGGIKYAPTFRAFTANETLATAADRITKDSGTTTYLVLRVFEYEDHMELDLRDIKDD